MKTIADINQLRACVKQARQAGQRVALVPTMGNLHEGHLALITRAKQAANFIVASVFVNPLQFGPNEDLDSYPRTLADDQQKLVQAGCNVLFTPTEQLMYPNGMQAQTLVRVPGVSEGLCGGSRPGHFDGVATIVNKLFNMVQPDCAIFGEKDFQQLAVIRKMVQDLNLPVEIIGAPIVRSADGLALSSRNGYLSAEQRHVAPQLQHCLQDIVARIQAGRRDYAVLLQEASNRLQTQGFVTDYMELRQATDLQPATPASKQLVILVAAVLGETRLIDNIIFDLL
ncbi:MAG: pantoate--beta-alanine ligase [Thiopseudomonas sp.]|nr:pantoate--beta-alanine ligase [Thiopseudomonas sp.]MCK9465311.1 pantoate--beta-alanine ligase [Thiopseudomonas sp.]